MGNQCSQSGGGQGRPGGGCEQDAEGHQKPGTPPAGDRVARDHDEGGPGLAMASKCTAAMLTRGVAFSILAFPLALSETAQTVEPERP